MQIQPDITLNQIVEAYPATLSILSDLGFDTCCGGWEPLGQAAERKGIPWEKVTAALTPLVSGA